MTDVGRLTGDGQPSAVVRRWTGAQYGPPQRVNTPGTTFCPSVSPDGQYIFYTANRDIYWVSAAILERLRANALR